MNKQKDPGIALILEILPGLFGFLGFGWIYVGNTTRGVITLIGFFVWDVIAGLTIALTGGFGALCTIPISIIAIIVSSVTLNTYVKNFNAVVGP